MIVIQFILAFLIMVTLHELGHFLMCKAFHIEVEEFGIGLPPRICKMFTADGTDFTLNWLPFGAFVRPKGEDVPGSESEENSLKAAAPWKQFIICMAGPIMNLLTAALIFWVIAAQVGQPDPSVVLIDQVQPNSPAETAGIMAGDQIISVNGEKIQSYNDVSTIVKKYADQEIPLEVLRDGETKTLKVTPLSNPPEGRGAMGIVITFAMKDYTIPQSFIAGFQDMGYMVKQYLVGLGQVISGKLEMGLNSIVGPVGMYSYYKDAAQMDEEAAQEQAERKADESASGAAKSTQKTASNINSPWMNRLNFFAVIAIALGVTNLFPIPALDGGRMLFLLPEMLFKKKIPDKVEAYINSAFMILLLVLMAVVMFKDIFTLTNG